MSLELRHQLRHEEQVGYLLKILEVGLPEHFVALDTTRLTGLYFAVLGLDILGALDKVDKKRVVDYVLAMQISADKTGLLPGHCGFIGSSFLGQAFGCYECGESGRESGDLLSKMSFCSISAEAEVKVKATPAAAAARYMQGHLAMAYTSLVVLQTLDKDKIHNGCVDKKALVDGMKLLQQPDGSFCATLEGNECDMRFLYCACAVSAILGDWSAVNVEAAVSYVKSCITYEGGISLVPGAEAHGGSCYTAVASLVLMGRLDACLGERGKEALTCWCYSRVHDEGGYNGRTNKETDSCYSFWVGATLSLLGAFDGSDHGPTLDFLLDRCQVKKPDRGGFCKSPEHSPDILHTFYTLCWLSMSCRGKELGLREIDNRFACCKDRIPESLALA